MPEGSIKKTVSDRGFGFLIPEGGGEDVFFHVSALKEVKIEALREGDHVEYEAETGDKGPKATEVRKKE
ncbi:MAG: cold shock domain-containing protein [Desulfobacterales bacterium]|nr:cold shock domain-containing protein [Desulfobacterales bacterium]MBS3810043.1 cold shock domain-containing protein [Desulfobacterales bacterium]